jgi:hypothetical protein
MLYAVVLVCVQRGWMIPIDKIRQQSVIQKQTPSS